MNVAISRKNDDIFRRGQICKIVELDGHIATIETQNNNRVSISVDDKDFLIVFSASYAEINLITNYLF